MFRFGALLVIAGTMAMAAPAAAQTASGTPAFRVPLGSTASPSSGPATYAWMQNVATCSNACGNGTRATTYQCQDVSSYDFGGAGYGAPEADAMCSSSPRPADSTTNCTNYSGCSYDWVKPAATVTILQKTVGSVTYPKGAVDDCSYAKRTFAPYCQRGGTPSVQMPAGDHAFCKNDTPDYNDVANNVPDALGYDRTSDDTSGCVAGTRDHEWTYTAWSGWDSTCSLAPKRTRQTDQCVLKFNGAARLASFCAGIPTVLSETKAADLSGCTFSWTIGNYGSYDSSCSDSATRTRTVTCTRADGATVADSFCTATQGAKPATSESGPVYSSCTYSWGTPSAWGAWTSGCSANTNRSRTVSCVRSTSPATNVADSFCSSAGAKPATTENGSNYASCTYTPRDMGRSACTNNNIEQYWDCTRSDGQTGFPASYCGKTNPENIACTSYTYTPREIGRTTCSGSQQQVSWDCTRSDGATGYPASFCGKTSPETVSCTMPPVYTYTPVNRGETACSGSQKQVYWDCTRNDGQTGFPASMCGKTNPETQSCTMPYTYTPVNRGESACSGGQKNVYWDCTRSDGVTGFPASNCGKTNPEVQSCTMPYTYTPVYRGESACAGSQKNVYWDCTRSDGTQGFPASMCGKTNPEVQSCTMPYTYTPVNRGESACSGGQKNVYWDCTRSDGTQGFPASNCGKTNPEVQTCTMPVTYSWAADGWSAYNSGCSASATRTRNVYCLGSDGSRPGDAPCGGGKPASSETTPIYSSCTYANEDTGNSGCVSGTRTYTTQCRRSDGNLVATSNCGNNGTRTEACTLTCGWVWYQNPGPGQVACGPAPPMPTYPSPWTMGPDANGVMKCVMGSGGAYRGTNPEPATNFVSSPDYVGTQCTEALNGRGFGTQVGIPYKGAGSSRAANWRCTCTG